jgi:hypothetical protein
MGEIRLVARNGEAVGQALERGEILHLDTASEEIKDEFCFLQLRVDCSSNGHLLFPTLDVGVR